MTARAEVVAYRWEEFADWFGKAWKPGEHLALIGPTGTGKSTAAVNLLPLRKWVMALDPKGGDSTLATLLHHGFERVETWPPPRQVMKRLENREPLRLVVGPVVQTRADLVSLQGVVGRALADAFEMGGWTVYVDELQIAADRRFMGHGAAVELLLISARDKGVSVVTSFQRPANVPRAASEMSRWMAVYYTRDIEVVNRLAEMAGRPKAEIRGAMKALGDLRYGLMMFSQDPNLPIVVTRPPKAA